MAAESSLSVLVVDDEPGIRVLLQEILRQDYRVRAAPSGAEALDLFATEPADIVVTDIRMPGMDGLALLRRLRAQRAELPVIVVTAHADKLLAIRALKEGAFDFIEKPFEDVELLAAVSRASSHCMLQKAAQLIFQEHKALIKGEATRTAEAARTPAQKATAPVGTARGIALIGGSFGSTEAIAKLFLRLPADLPPIVVAVHLGVGFTQPFATRLDAVCQFPVAEAVHDQPLLPGRVYIAPAGKHATLRKQKGGYALALSNEPSGYFHVPSIDVLLSSAATAAGKDAVGVILTGLGDDGAKGLLEMRKAGAFTVAQDEASSAVFGMPKKAIEQGGVCKIAGLDAMHQVIADAMRGVLAA